MICLKAHRFPIRSTPFAVRLLVVLVTLFYGLMAHANIISTSHNPPNWSGHDNSVHLSGQSGDHGHSHDAPETDDRNASHQHENHAFDHSHDKSNLPPSDSHVVVKLPDMWAMAPQVIGYPEPCFSFERPPKSLLMY